MQYDVRNNPYAVVQAINETLLPRGLAEPVRLVSFRWPVLIVESGGERASIHLRALSAYHETRDSSYAGPGRDRVSWQFTLRQSDWFSAAPDPNHPNHGRKPQYLHDDTPSPRTTK